MIVFTKCISDTITVPYTDYTFTKSNFGMIVVLLDIIVICSFYLFAEIIKARQLEYIREFKL